MKTYADSASCTSGVPRPRRPIGLSVGLGLLLSLCLACSPPEDAAPDGATMGVEDGATMGGDDGGATTCGDALCEGTETCASCAEDCGECPDEPICGDARCDPTETCEDCAEDCGACPPSPEPYTHAALLARRSGFAAMVTGAGADADTDATRHVWVTSTSDAGPGSLREALSVAGRWVRFDDSLGPEPTITLTSGPIVPAADITLDGRGKHVTIMSSHTQTVFDIENDNQIFVNLEVVIDARDQNPQADCFNINGGGGDPVDDVWINHVTMSGARDKRVGVPFGADVTIDWCHMFGGTGHGVLVGCMSCSRPEVSFTTMHHNYMHDLPDRYPRVSDGHHVHAYNNVSANWAYYAMGAVRDGELVAENNWFTPGGDDTAIKASEGAHARGIVRATGNVLNGGTEEQNAPARAFTPPYAYDLDVADPSARERVVAEAGWQPASFWDR
ncbi:MAG: hypothetical protein RLO52_33045 [Sandaracinaceae bacterium]